MSNSPDAPPDDSRAVGPIDSAQTGFYLAVERATAVLDLVESTAASARDAARRVHELGQALTRDLDEVRLRECGAGCSACCHFTVGLRAPEAMLLATAIESHQDSARLRARILQASTSTERGIARCPLLDDAGTCAAYDHRPLPCRGWTASSRELCDAHRIDPTVPPSPLPVAFGIHLGLGQALDDWSKRAGLTVGPSPLPGALRSALEVLDTAGGGLPQGQERNRAEPTD